VRPLLRVEASIPFVGDPCAAGKADVALFPVGLLYRAWGALLCLKRSANLQSFAGCKL
jgi:hypothetical protein